MTYRNYPSLLNLSLLFILMLVAGCSVSPDNFSESGYSIQNDETQLQVRLTETNQVVEIQSASNQSLNRVGPPSFSLNLVAEIDAPVVDGVVTQATMVDIFGNSARAAVSYNVQGADYIGAIDAVQVTSSSKNAIRVRSGIEFSNANSNALYMDENDLWIAQSTNDPSITQNGTNSVARKFDVSGFSISDNPVHVSIPGFAANSIHESDGSIYITSGSNAGLTILNQDFTEQIDFVPIPHARWVNTDDSRIVVLSGNPNADNPNTSGILYILDKTDRSVLHEYPFSGADTPEAKNTVEIKGDLAVVAAGQSGTHLIDLNNGDLLATIPAPDADALGLNPADVESNAASANEEYIFIANGEAGVYVAEASMDLDQYTTGDQLSVDLLGYLKFDDSQSANHVAYRNNTLFVAAGLGGVKTVKLSRK